MMLNRIYWTKRFTSEWIQKKYIKFRRYYMYRFDSCSDCTTLFIQSFALRVKHVNCGHIHIIYADNVSWISQMKIENSFSEFLFAFSYEKYYYLNSPTPLMQLSRLVRCLSKVEFAITVCFLTYPHPHYYL